MENGKREGVEETISVTSKDPKHPKDETGKPKQQGDEQPSAANGKGDGKLAKTEAQLSEEDTQLQQELEMLVERLNESDKSLHRPALESLRSLIRTSTSSMTSVPKPLKFLRPHYPALQELYEQWPQDATTDLFADVLSVLAMTYSDSGKRETLKYRLRGGVRSEDPGDWGHEYVRHLAAEIGEEFNARSEEPESEATSVQPLRDLAMKLVPFFLSHNAEADAVDLLLELEDIQAIIPFVQDSTYTRVCSYIVGCVNLLVAPDDKDFLETARSIYRKQGRYTEAITLSMRLGNMDLIVEDFQSPSNLAMQKQLAYLLARQQVTLPTELLSKLEEEQPILLAILNNTQLSEHYKSFATTLSLLEPKSLEDIYKSHLDDNPSSGSRGTGSVDSARQNLAGTFVNAFVNAACGNEKLLVGAEEGQSWIYKTKESGMLSAAASLGLSLLWDPENGLSQIDKYSYATEEYIKAGALLADGIIHSGIKTEMDAALALLSDHVESKSVPLRFCSIIGLGIAYAGTAREDISELISPSVSDSSVSMEIASLAALALGFVFVGSGNGEIAGSILEALMERDEKDLNEKWSRFMALALGLLYLGRQDESDATIETLKAIEHPLSKQAIVIVEACSFAGTGNVLKVQAMLHYCNDHLNLPDDGKKETTQTETPANLAAGLTDAAAGGAANSAAATTEGEAETPKKEEENDTFQTFAVLGIAIVAMGEDIGAEMSLRHFNHLMHYGEPVVRRSVPLALGLLSPSNPQLTVLDTLSRYSHDNDLDVAMNAIFAMGLVGAGTNNAKLAQMLRQLAGYYHKEPDCLFVVRIAQGLVHMGKGTIGLNPFHTDRFLMSPVAVAGLLSTLVAFTDCRGLILEKSHWMLYFLVMAMYPRFLITFDEEGEQIPISVRVGQAVDVIGQAGKPRTISGFQTHQTPVRMGQTERAELATEEYWAYSHVLEGFVVAKKNAQFDKDEAAASAKMEM